MAIQTKTFPGEIEERIVYNRRISVTDEDKKQIES